MYRSPRPKFGSMPLVMLTVVPHLVFLPVSLRQIYSGASVRPFARPPDDAIRNSYLT